MNEKLRFAAADVKRNTKIPIWYWSGFVIIALLICVGIYSNQQHSKDVVSYINEPAIGDIIEYKNSENGHYSTLKISAITTDSIFVIQNNYETDKIGGVSDIDKEKNYTAPPYSLGRDELKNLFDEKIFYDINR